MVELIRQTSDGKPVALAVVVLGVEAATAEAEVVGVCSIAVAYRRPIEAAGALVVELTINQVVVAGAIKL